MTEVIPIRARSLVDRVVQIIGPEIVGGRFAPGDSLPNEPNGVPGCR